eukprot:420092_1
MSQVAGDSVMVFCLFVDVITISITFYQLCIKKHYIANRTYIQNLILFAMLFYTLCAIGDIINMLVFDKKLSTSHEWTPPQAYLAGFNDIMYYLGNLSFFLFLLTSIRRSFQISKQVMYYLYLLLIVSLVCSAILFYVIVSSAGGTLNQMDDKLHKITPSLATIDFILNFSLFILFIYKIKNKDSIEGVEMEADVSSQPSSVDDIYEKKAIWNLMIKHGILFGIALFANQIFYVMIIMVTWHVSLGIITFGAMASYTGRAVENTINIVILWLVLKFNNNKYICVCKCCHLCILRYCMKEDPNIIREGFIINENYSVSENEQKLYSGHDLLVTNERSNNKANNFKGRVEGHNVVITEQQS